VITGVKLDIIITNKSDRHISFDSNKIKATIQTNQLELNSTDAGIPFIREGETVNCIIIFEAPPINSDIQLDTLILEGLSYALKDTRQWQGDEDIIIKIDDPIQLSLLN
jgi:hypothetical protein